MPQREEPFAKPEPPVRNEDFSQSRTQDIYEPIRQARRPNLQKQSEDRNRYGYDQSDTKSQPFESNLNESRFLNRSPIDDAQSSAPPTDSQRLDNVKSFQQKSFSMLEQVRNPKGWVPNSGRHNSSVSAVMSPRLRHTPNGIEFNFSDVNPLKFATQAEDQTEDQVDGDTFAQSNETEQQEETPDWGSILGNEDGPDSQPGSEQVPSEAIAGDSDFEDEPTDGLDAESEDDEIDLAREIQSIEKQRDGYRQALRRPMSTAPAQLALQYVDDNGQPVPTSKEQKHYLAHFNGYRYSPYYNNECRVDSSGYSWCPAYALWRTPNLCHNPLYFEEVNLERFGARFPGQPFLSAGHFFASIVTLPYASTVQPPHQCVYSAGYGRPGNKYSYQFKRPMWSRRGATFQGLLLAGLIVGLP